MRLVTKLLLVLVCTLTATAAEAVTSPGQPKGADRQEAMTTGAATRARADVQIRRIRELLVSKKMTDDDATYKELETLQRQLRGQN